MEGNLRKIFNIFRLKDPKSTSSKISCFFKIDDGSFVFSNCTILLKRPERAVCYDARDEAWEEEQLEGSDIHLVSVHPIERKKVTHADKFDFLKEKSQYEGKSWTYLWEAATTERSHRKNTEVSFQKVLELFHWDTLKSNV